MEEKNCSISQGKTEAFLVYDRTLKSIHASFYSWLWNEGFTDAGPHGNYGCQWVYINITHKQYAYGMPGVALVQPIGNHAITIDEFVTIYHIYAKYQGRKPLVFT